MYKDVLREENMRGSKHRARAPAPPSGRADAGRSTESRLKWISGDMILNSRAPASARGEYAVVHSKYSPKAPSFVRRRDPERKSTAYRRANALARRPAKRFSAAYAPPASTSRTPTPSTSSAESNLQSLSIEVGATKARRLARLLHRLIDRHGRPR